MVQDLSIETKKVMLRQMIEEQSRMAYAFELQGKAAKKMGDDVLYQRSLDSLTKAQGMIEYYQNELQLLEAGSKPN